MAKRKLSRQQRQRIQQIQARRQAVADYFATLDTREKFADAMAAINIAWGDVLDKYNLLWVGAENSGNEVHVARRRPPAFDAAPSR